MTTFMQRATMALYSLVSFITVSSITLTVLPSAQASEGMWLASEQPELANNLPLAAVARVGACSGVFVSEQGLLLTNSHCIEETMQLRSDAQHNIREKGFLARSLAAELPAAPGFFASVTLSQSDITESMTKGVTATMSPRERHLALTRNKNAIIRSCEAAAQVSCQVQAHQDGLHYLLVRERELRDVRLVYVAPTTIAMYGGDEANWQWPRFSADIAVMRVYTAPDGTAADFANDNIPYTPSEYAQIADTHLTFFDPVRVVGYPNTTQRFRTAAEMQWAFSEQYPELLSYLKGFESIIANYAASNNERSSHLQPTLLRLRNQMTNVEAQLAEYQLHGIQQLSEKSQEQLLGWLAVPERQEQYRGAWWMIQQQLEADRQWLPQQMWWQFLQELSLPGAALLVHRYAYEQSMPEDIRAPGFQQRDLHILRAQLDNYANRMDIELEQEMLVYMLNRYRDLPAAQQSAAITTFFGLTAESTEDKLRARVAELYVDAKLLSVGVRTEWLNHSLSSLEKADLPWLQFAKATAAERLAIDDREIESQGRISFARPRMMAAQRDYDQSQGRMLPANANRTLRISEGQVLGYKPDPDPNNYLLALTYLDVFGDHLKEQSDNSLPRTFRNAATRHAKHCFTNPARGSVTVNYITTADGALGSSGSPTFDPHGHLLGLVFDLMAESTMSDWIYNRDQHRLVHVDVRYLLWILGYYEGANELLAELGFNFDKSKLVGSCRAVPLKQS